MPDVKDRTLLVFQTAYSYQEMVDRDLTIFFTSKDLGGYFNRIITVHPISDYSKMLETEPEFALTRFIQHDKHHVFIEGRVARYHFLRRFKSINFLIAQLDLFLAIRRYTKDEQIDFIRAEDPRFNGLWGVLFHWLTKAPLFVGNWGNPATVRALTGRPLMPRFFKKIWLETIIEKKVFNAADCVMAQNADNLQFILDCGIDRSKTAIFKLGNAVNQCHFVNPNQRKPVFVPLLGDLQPSTRILLCAFAIEKRKILEDAFEVLNVLKKEFEIKLVVAGDGSAREFYTGCCDDMKLTDDVIFLGNVSQETLAYLMVKADVILSPLTGRALAESVLSSTPVVAYDIDCHPELIESGLTGELVPFRNWKEMAEKTAFLLKNSEYAERIGRIGRVKALEFMDPAVINESQIRVFQKHGGTT
jgi:glycosyltransferase involved in cell wall biosynthesis